jgi:hypothetical protein
VIKRPSQYERDKWVDILLAKIGEEFVAEYLNEFDTDIIVCEVSEIVYDEYGFLKQKWYDHGDLSCLYSNWESGWDELKWQGYGYHPKYWPHEDFMIDAQNTFDNKPVKPNWYYFMNCNFTYIYKLNVRESRDHWFVRPGNHRFSNFKKNFYCLTLDDMDKFVEKIEVPSELRMSNPNCCYSKKELRRLLKVYVDGEIDYICK